ncbi:MAG TPA: ester cyclase [Verrucomicrobiae bacterium]|nr:ester cyclase [Verrucomicrobiae bacterium]
MRLSAEDYRNHYRSLSDEELLAINSADLVEIARRCYDAEMARRCLEPLPPEAEPEPEGPDVPPDGRAPDEDMIQIALLTDRPSAMAAQQLLLDANVPAELATVPGTHASRAFGLLVPASCADDARELIAVSLTGSNQLLVRRWFEQEWTPERMELSDFSVTIEDLFGETDKVAVRLTARGQNPHTGRNVEFGGLAIVRVADGRIAETWIRLDPCPPS